MKFARYLEDTQIPEWKRAYIDYRGLKKRIAAIRAAQHNENPPPQLAHPVLDTNIVQTRTSSQKDPSGVSAQTFLAGIAHEDGDAPNADGEAHDSSFSRQSDIVNDAMHLNADAPSSSNVLSPQGIEDTNGPTGTSGIVPSATLSGSLLPRVGRSKSLRGGWDLAKSIPLKDLIPALTRVQKAFFEKLDSELDKVETFYVEREKDMRTRTTVLKSQLHELQEHRRVFHQAEQANHPWFTMRQSKILRNPYHLLDKNLSKRRSYKAQSESPPRRQPEVSENNTMEEMTGSPRLKSPFQHLENSENGTLKDSQANGSNSTSASGASGAEDVPKGWQKVHHSFRTHAVTNKLGPQTHPNGASKYDPDEYVHAKKSLKKAVLECYRGLEVLENYRTLNLIGFRKALKKFEKTTGIPAQQAYFMEKIEPSAFSSGVAVQGMVNQMEELYAARFTRGDNKLAKTRLRGGQARHKTRHSSVFISGLLLGMAIPAFADAIYLSFQPETRRAIPGHDGLLYVYSIFLIPVLFILLVGVNILGWHRARINYVFIFEFDLKTKLDYREFFEIPAILLSTLCYALWFSFARIGSSHLSPTFWPLIWLACSGFIVFNPLPVFNKTARWWFLKNMGRQLTSGLHRVEFADFWMGDQFCSLIYPISNLYLLACAYSGGLDQTWNKCLSPGPWGVPFLLASLPLLARLIQSVRRWVDSRLTTHLINGGKYAAGIVYYVAYYNWRHHGGGRGGDFVAWCVFGTIYALYASAWDFLMDWSVFRPHAQYPLLRDNVLYSNNIPLYYLAIATNLLIRFIWVLYIPQRGPPFPLRTFIAAMLEMLRRWQWNFFRLENEHLGNVDQYRVTREVPLPYSFDDAVNDSEGDDDSDQKSISSWRNRRRAAKAEASKDVYKAGADTDPLS